MIPCSYIEDTLVRLEKLYNQASANRSGSAKTLIYYSKMSLLELCGWIEEATDDIIKRHSGRKLKLAKNKKLVAEFVKKNYGFEYEANIRQMLARLIGIIELEKLELKLEKASSITLMRSVLEQLKIRRNSAAHTHLKGVLRTYDAPSVILSEYNRVMPLLKKLDEELRKL